MFQPRNKALDAEIKEMDRIIEKLPILNEYIMHPFFTFYQIMVDVYNEHVPEKGESWRQMSWAELMDGLANQFEDLQNDPGRENYYANIANYAAMLYFIANPVDLRESRDK